MSPLERKLRRVASSLDAGALEALASRGLLRRAQKDLERGIETRLTGETEFTLRVSVGDFEVQLPEAGPAMARCSCPSPGVCQHILIALLFLQQPCPEAGHDPAPDTEQTEAPATPEEEVMDITPEQMERWAGKNSFKAGLKFAIASTPEIVCDLTIRVRFPAFNSEVRFVPGAGLDGAIVSGGSRDQQMLAVAAVIAIQRAKGRQYTVSEEDSALQASEGAPRTRSEVLHACQMLLHETLSNGLSRVSTANQQRWTTLSVSALGVNLPRLALALRGIGDEAGLALARDARSDLERLLVRMAKAHALCAALQNGGDNPRSDLVGLHRTRYEEVGHLDLMGVAAWPWRTASGYEGLTVLFWDSSGNQWNSWTDSRPLHQLAGFNPLARYLQTGPWNGAESPRQLAQSSFRLMNARRNLNARLSGSSKSRGLVTGPADLQRLAAVATDNWSELSRVANSLTAIGLKETNPLDAVFVVKPEVWGERRFDPVTQTFTWLIADPHEQWLPVEIHFDQFSQPAITFLETVAPESLRGSSVIGRIERTQHGCSLHPYSLHKKDNRIIHLYLEDATPAAPMREPPHPVEEEAIVGEEETEILPEFCPALGRLIDELDDALLATAEAGLTSFVRVRKDRFAPLAARAQNLGLHALHKAVEAVRDNPRPFVLLRLAYLTQIHRQASLLRGDQFPFESRSGAAG